MAATAPFVREEKSDTQPFVKPQAVGKAANPVGDRKVLVQDADGHWRFTQDIKDVESGRDLIFGDTFRSAIGKLHERYPTADGKGTRLVFNQGSGSHHAPPFDTVKGIDNNQFPVPKQHDWQSDYDFAIGVIAEDDYLSSFRLAVKTARRAGSNLVRVDGIARCNMYDVWRDAKEGGGVRRAYYEDVIPEDLCVYRGELNITDEAISRNYRFIPLAGGVAIDRRGSVGVLLEVVHVGGKKCNQIGSRIIKSKRERKPMLRHDDITSLMCEMRDGVEHLCREHLGSWHHAEVEVRRRVHYKTDAMQAVLDYEGLGKVIFHARRGPAWWTLENVCKHNFEDRVETLGEEIDKLRKIWAKKREETGSPGVEDCVEEFADLVTRWRGRIRRANSKARKKQKEETNTDTEK